MALLEHTDLDLSQKVDTGDGKYNYYDRVIRDWNHKKGGFGVITMREAIERSSNIAISKAVDEAFGHNPKVFINFLSRIGIDKKLGLSIAGEPEPLIKKPGTKLWSGVTLAWMSHGYGVEMTPLQMATFFNAIPNNGCMIQPMLVSKISSAGRVIEKFSPKIIKKRICNKRTLGLIKELLDGVVDRGGAQLIKKGVYQISGKSGTAQRIINNRYTKSWYVSFIGYFPREAPLYTCYVGVDNPKGYKLYGSDMAAPIMRSIADHIAVANPKLYIDIKKEEISSKILFKRAGGFKQDVDFTLSKFGILSENRSNFQKDELIRICDSEQGVAYAKNLQTAHNQMPNLLLFSLKDAIFILEQNGIKFIIKGKGGMVRRQSVRPGTKISKGDLVEIELF